MSTTAGHQQELSRATLVPRRSRESALMAGVLALAMICASGLPVLGSCLDSSSLCACCSIKPAKPQPAKKMTCSGCTQCEERRSACPSKQPEPTRESPIELTARHGDELGPTQQPQANEHTTSAPEPELRSRRASISSAPDAVYLLTSRWLL